jgi:hypothetical protein
VFTLFGLNSDLNKSASDHAVKSLRHFQIDPGCVNVVEGSVVSSVLLKKKMYLRL